jgi:hypothetical protein
MSELPLHPTIGRPECDAAFLVGLITAYFTSSIATASSLYALIAIYEERTGIDVDLTGSSRASLRDLAARISTMAQTLEPAFAAEFGLLRATLRGIQTQNKLAS